MLIEAHTHYLTPRMLARLRARGEPPYVATAADGAERLHSREAIFAFGAEHHDRDTRAAFMRSLGVARQIVSFPAGRGLDVLAGDDGVTAVREYNDDLSAECRADPTLAGLGGLPWNDLAAACAEIRRLRLELGLIGAVVPAGWFFSEARLARIAPVLAAADEVGALLMIHPSPAPDDDPPRRFADHAMHRTSTVELFGALAQVLVTLLCSEQLDGHRNLAVHLIDCAGAGLVAIERMQQMQAVRGGTSVPRLERLERVVFDNSSLGPRALECAVRTWGAERLMFGTDYPYFPIADSLVAIDAAEITPAAREQIRWRTAAALVQRFGGWSELLDPAQGDAPAAHAPTAGETAVA
jgi:aminocarboxymuconate-semialdehyde decarboxylase